MSQALFLFLMDQNSGWEAKKQVKLVPAAAEKKTQPGNQKQVNSDNKCVFLEVV